MLRCAGVVDVLELGEVVALAGVEVVYAVGGSGVDGSGALFGGDVVGDDAEDLAVEEGMLEGDAVEASRRGSGQGCQSATAVRRGWSARRLQLTMTEESSSSAMM